MTVAELIARLQPLPQGARVMTQFEATLDPYDATWEEVTEVMPSFVARPTPGGPMYWGPISRDGGPGPRMAPVVCLYAGDVDAMTAAATVGGEPRP